MSSLTFVFVILSLFDVSTYPPGYLELGCLTEEEYLSKSFLKLANDKLQTKIRVNEVEIPLKYCHTCKIIREVRSFHCDICGFCIKKHGIYNNDLDHHCPFVSNCIGENNLHKFFIFLIGVYIHSANVFIISLVIFIDNRYNDIWNYKDFINIFVIAYTAIINITILIMVLMQTYLISVNKTTNECCRGKLTETNPFDKNCSENWKEVFDC